MNVLGMECLGSMAGVAKRDRIGNEVMPWGNGFEKRCHAALMRTF